ncbi:MAG: hypothetical protein ABSB76_26790 [Streptosporangiaceae bacterium]|jgi:4-carboxymuconolactone decarboxylase
MDDAQADRAAFDTAERLLGAPLFLPLGPGEPPSGDDFRRLATRHTFGDSWTRTGLDVRSRALVSVTIAATLGTREPLRGQLRIARGTFRDAWMFGLTRADWAAAAAPDPPTG